MHTCTFTVDGAIGGGRTFQAKVFANIVSFRIDVDKQLLELVDEDGVSSFIDISTMASITVSDSGGFVTAVTVAD